MKRNRYKLISGHWSRWEGSKETGTRAHYSPKEGSNYVENVTPAELAVMGARLVLVAGVSPVSVPELPELEPETPAKKSVAKEPETEEPVEETVEEPVEEATEFSSWAEVVSGSLKDVVAAVKVIEDLDDLAELRKAEMKGLKRKGVLAAIEERKTVLKAGG